MRATCAALFFLIIALVWSVPSAVFADTIVDTEISEDTEWTKEGSPYLIQEGVTIDGNATLSIGPGVVVQFDADSGMNIFGRLLVQGAPDESIIFTSTTDSGWRGIDFFNPEAASSLDNAVIQHADTAILDFYSKDLSVSNTRVEGGGYGIDAYGSHLSLDNFSVENLSDDAVDIYNGSDVILKNITLKNVGAGIGVYTESTADIVNLVIDHSKYEALALYDGCSVRVASSTLTNGDTDAIGIYAGSSVDIRDSVISGFVDGSGIVNYNSLEYPANSISLVHNEITNNTVGISVYSDNSSYTISNNKIYQNVLFGFEWYGTGSVDVSNNFWGDASGPYHDLKNLTGKGNAMYDWDNTVIFSPWLSFWGTPPSSNVLFLPGIEGSRLYEGTGCGKNAEEKLWEPYEGIWSALRGAGDKKVQDLFLNQDGTSICDDVYAKENDIIDLVGGDNIYKSFISDMNGLKTDSTIVDWKPVAYDWRLSLDGLLKNGTERGGKIYYAEATSTPYIEQTLRALAASSKTGKVTIIAHSNGGLVAKALLNKLRGETPQLVDNVIMVGAPQSGAPEALGAVLMGYNAGIYKLGFPIVSNAVAQELAKNSPMAYHLLPSENYLESIAGDANHPVARFAGDAYAKEISAYGATLTNSTDLTDFLRASSLNSSLISYANVQHSVLDSWTPPDDIEVDQIAGWGADTVAGIDFYTQQSTDAITALEPTRAYRPIFTEDGDGVVPVPSALMIASSTSVKRYWVDLHGYKNGTNIIRSHKDIFEIPSLQDFIKNIITNSTSTLPTYISTDQPPTNTENKKLTFFLHSPLTLQITDSSGNITGLAEDGSMTQDIPDSTYGEFGEVKYITVPEGSNYQLTMHGQASGTFSLDIQETTSGIITASSTIASVPTTASTLASLTISGGIDTASALSVDENGDGKNMITITPKVGETVNYKSPVPVSVSASKSSSSSGSRNTRIPVIVPVVVATSDSTSSPQASTPKVAVSPAKIIQVKKPQTSISITPPKKTNVNIPQTASVYDASQQPLLMRWGSAVYNGLHRFWSALKKLF